MTVFPRRQLIDPRLGPPQDGVHARQQFVERERLGDVVVGAQHQTADPVLLLAARRQDDHRDAVGLVVEGPADLEAVRAVRQHDVEQQQVRREPLHGGERLPAAVAGLHEEPFVLQVVAQEPGHRVVVLDDQDSLGHVADISVPGHPVRRRPLVGNVTSTSVPAPTSLRTSIRPPWLSTMRFAIGSPRPLPLVETLRPR